MAEPTSESGTEPGSEAAEDAMSEGTSAAWIRRLKHRPDSQTVWSSLTDRYQNRILVFAAQRLGPGLRRLVQPEEVVNEAWMKVIQNLPHFEYRHRGSLYSWLCLQVTRVVADLARSEGRHGSPASLDGGGDSGASSIPGIAVADSSPGPVTEIGIRDAKERLTAALEKVPTIYRDVLIAFYLEDKTREEIARQFDRKPNTVTQQLRRGKDLWREAFGGDLESHI